MEGCHPCSRQGTDAARRTAGSPVRLAAASRTPLGLATLVGLRSGCASTTSTSTGVPGVDRRSRPARERAPHRTGLQRPLAARDGRGGRAVRAQRRRRSRDPERSARRAPRDISEALMDRTRFLPASHLNVLAAAWLQFEVHDWMSHAKEPPIGDWLLDAACRCRRRSRPAPTRRRSCAARPHWWDASQLYGTHAGATSPRSSASDGEIAVDDELLRALERAGRELQRARGEPVGRARAAARSSSRTSTTRSSERLREVYPHWGADRAATRRRG